MSAECRYNLLFADNWFVPCERTCRLHVGRLFTIVNDMKRHEWRINIDSISTARRIAFKCDRSVNSGFWQFSRLSSSAFKWSSCQTGRTQKPSTSSLTPFDAHCCHMGTAIQYPVPDQVKPLFVILTSGYSDGQHWASECPYVKNYKWLPNLVWHRILYSYMAAVAVEGLTCQSS